MCSNEIFIGLLFKIGITAIMDKLKAVDVDLDQIEQSARILNTAERVIQRYTDEILRFLELDTITNQEMRRVLDHISVDRDGNVRIVLKKIKDTNNHNDEHSRKKAWCR
jgi:hypothetical protein